MRLFLFRFLKVRLFSRVSDDANIAAFHDRSWWEPDNRGGNGNNDDNSSNMDIDEEESLLEAAGYSEEYALNDFQLLCRKCYK